jgi:DNA-binding transcriptional LysR family regulator
MLNAGRVRLLVELEDRGSITAVAAALDYTPSAVSQQLTRLEAETGRRLFERVGRGVLLTDAGRLLAAHGRQVLERLEAAEMALEQVDAVSGRLRVGAFQTAAQGLAVPAFAALSERYPQLACELHDHEPETALPLLRSGRLDLVLAEEYEHAPRPRDPALERHELGPDELILALPAGHPTARRGDPVALGDLAGERWATPWEDTAYAAMVVRACRTAGFEPDVRHRVTDLHTLLDLARGGLAVALVPALGGPKEGKGLALRPVAGGGLRRSIFAAVRRTAVPRPAVDALLRELRLRTPPPHPAGSPPAAAPGRTA